MRRKKDKTSGYTVIYQGVSERKHYESLANRGELTGLYNRRHFNAVMLVMLERACREGDLCVLFLLDVDYFVKAIYEKADRAQYQAKQGGRDRFVAAAS